MDELSLSFSHDDETIRALCRGRQKLAGNKAAALTYTLLSVLLIAGVLLMENHQTAGLLLILSGCWGFVIAGNAANRQAKRIIKGLNGVFPHLSYSFLEKKLTVTFPKAEDEIPYSEIAGLYEDREYSYIYLRSTALYLIKKQSIQQSGALRGFLSDKTGLRWKPLRGGFNLTGLVKKLRGQ